MKTAMNEHIEQLKAMKVILSKQYEGNELLEVVTGTIDGCIVNSEHFIETEKQQIIEAYIEGYCAESGKGDSQQHYETTFKN